MFIGGINMSNMIADTNMKWRPALLILVTILSLCLCGCSGLSSSDFNSYKSPEPGLFTDSTIIFEGITRTYYYYVPNDLGSSLSPLVFLLHGGGSNTDDLTGESGFKAPYKVWMDVAEAEKFIVVYPEGTNNSFGDLGWNDCRADATTNPTVNDVGFIDALIGQLSSSFNIDMNRIYASGTSNG